MTIEKELQKYLKSLVHYGHKTNELNTKMSPYILSEENGYHIFNLFKVREALLLATNILKDKKINNQKILFVGTNKIFSSLIKEKAKEINSFYINNYWLGGTLTNWNTVQKIIEDLKNLELKLKENTNSKKEKLKFKARLDKLNYLFEGIKDMTSLPDIVIFIDQFKDILGIKECLKLGIPTICIVDSNCNPDIVSYPIPGNDDSLKSVDFILNYLTKKISKI